MSAATAEYKRLCKCGRTVMTSSTICGPCFAAEALADFVYRGHHSLSRRGICQHCGKERQLNSRDLCKSRCARLGLETQYPVMRGRERKKAPR